MYYLIILLSFFQKSPDANRTWNLRNEEHVFRRNFVQAPYITSHSDSIVFFFRQDSIISATHSWTSDTGYVWILYKEEGVKDFWENYIRHKYKRSISGQHLNGFPKAYMREYFLDHDIDVKTIIVYYAYSLVPHLAHFPFCYSCYTGTDFLIKIKKDDVKKLTSETQSVFLELGNRYW